MTMRELSVQYGESARLIAERVHELRLLEKASTDEADRQLLHRRIADLRPLLYQCREIQRLTDRYYDRSYYRNVEYSI